MLVNVLPGETFCAALVRPALDRVGYYRRVIEPYGSARNETVSSRPRIHT
jgi:hypothetical protein